MSPPMWGCGLKYVVLSPEAYEEMVTPYVGVWIEIFWFITILILSIVTPYVGVWIEILVGCGEQSQIDVTPYVGVWIEIKSECIELPDKQGHPLCGGVD